MQETLNGAAGALLVILALIVWVRVEARGWRLSGSLTVSPRSELDALTRPVSPARAKEPDYFDQAKERGSDG